MSSLSCGTLYSTVIVCCALRSPTTLPSVTDEEGKSEVTFARICMNKTLRVFSSGALSEGSHPFSFRTRQLSPLEPMVLTVTGGESR